MFTVRWKKSAANELARLWTDADSELRGLITTATHQLDQHLGTDPLAESESRPEGRRVLFFFPLGVTFQIEADERTVSVLRVWLFHKRRQS